jgi:hypothetical protein
VRVPVSSIDASSIRASAMSSPPRSRYRTVQTRSSPSVASEVTPVYCRTQSRIAGERHASVLAPAGVSRGGPVDGASRLESTDELRSLTRTVASTVCLPGASSTAVQVRRGRL